MGIRAIFEAVRAQVLSSRPSVSMELTAETRDWHSAPERVVWLLPEPGQEQHTRDQVYPGAAADAAHQGVLWSRRATCAIHVWISGVTDAHGVTYPEDNEDPAKGPVWLPAIVQTAIHDQCHGGYTLGQAGYLPRRDGHIGFVYVFEVSFDLAVYRVKTDTTATIRAVSQSGEIT